MKFLVRKSNDSNKPAICALCKPSHFVCCLPSKWTLHMKSHRCSSRPRSLFSFARQITSLMVAYGNFRGLPKRQYLICTRSNGNVVFAAGHDNDLNCNTTEKFGYTVKIPISVRCEQVIDHIPLSLKPAWSCVFVSHHVISENALDCEMFCSGCFCQHSFPSGTQHSHRD